MKSTNSTRLMMMLLALSPPQHLPNDKSSCCQNKCRDNSRPDAVHNQHASSAPQVQSPGGQANNRADNIDYEPKSKHRDNEYQTTIENTGAISVGRRNRRRSLNLTASEPLMDRGLNSFEPLANLNVVVAADVPQHEPGATGPFDLQIDYHSRLTRRRIKSKVHNRAMQEALTLAS